MIKINDLKLIKSANNEESYAKQLSSIQNAINSISEQTKRSLEQIGNLKANIKEYYLELEKNEKECKCIKEGGYSVFY